MIFCIFAAKKLRIFILTKIIYRNSITMGSVQTKSIGFNLRWCEIM